MKKYDVIIVGAGPAGLKCAKVLSEAGYDILLLEKNELPGDKICAGGITRKGFPLLDLPNHIIEHKVDEVMFHSPHFHHFKKLPEAVMYTVNRKELGRWQLGLLKNTGVEYRNRSRVSEIRKNTVIVNSNEAFGFHYLVGDDGQNSVVRKYLELPVEKILATVQYQIPVANPQSRLEIFLDSKYFHSWYAWIFPHRDTLAVGACSNVRYLSGKKLKENFHKWLDKQHLDITRARYESYPVSYDYRGFRFGNIFLAGEAAGLASGLTGEGIYQALLSGRQVACSLLNRTEEKDYMHAVTHYNYYQHKFLDWSLRLGIARNLLHDLVLLALKNKRINKRITHHFS